MPDDEWEHFFFMIEPHIYLTVTSYERFHAPHRTAERERETLTKPGPSGEAAPEQLLLLKWRRGVEAHRRRGLSRSLQRMEKTEGGRDKIVDGWHSFASGQNPPVSCCTKSMTLGIRVVVVECSGVNARAGT